MMQQENNTSFYKGVKLNILLVFKLILIDFETKLMHTMYILFAELGQ